MQMRIIICSIFFAALCSAQQEPNLPAQREAMKKLAFLVGKWSGDATSKRGRNEAVKVKQTEEVQFKLGGLVLLIEGTVAIRRPAKSSSTRWPQSPTMNPPKSTISGHSTTDTIWTQT